MNEEIENKIAEVKEILKPHLQSVFDSKIEKLKAKDNAEQAISDFLNKDIDKIENALYQFQNAQRKKAAKQTNTIDKKELIKQARRMNSDTINSLIVVLVAELKNRWDKEIENANKELKDIERKQKSVSDKLEKLKAKRSREDKEIVEEIFASTKKKSK